MKKLSLLFALTLIITAAFAQEGNNQVVDNPAGDTVYKTRHMLGINVFPAFGILGGGIINNSKIALQYKALARQVNFRISLNYLNYYRNNNAFDLVGVVADTTPPATADGDTIFESMKIRSYYNQVNTYDLRAGVEYAIDRKDIRFYLGAGGIIGLHNIVNSYHYYYKPFTGFPVEYVNIPYDFSQTATQAQMRSSSFLKMGFDLSLGVDFMVTENCVVALQYTPEFAYYKWLKSTRYNDVDNIYDTNLNSFWVFSPDFIDLIIYIRF